jgi:hypothetical protein
MLRAILHAREPRFKPPKADPRLPIMQNYEIDFSLWKAHASGADRRIVNPPVTRRLSSVITITGTGDHLRLDQPIIFTGMRTD